MSLSKLSGISTYPLSPTSFASSVGLSMSAITTLVFSKYENSPSDQALVYAYKKLIPAYQKLIPARRQLEKKGIC